LAHRPAGSTTSLTNKAVSLVSRHSPVAAERVSLSRLTGINLGFSTWHQADSAARQVQSLLVTALACVRW
jgi:hypothetical protein